jgi:hypothetical protein
VPDATMLERMLSAGLALIPIPRGRKAPSMQAWNRREACITDPTRADELAGQNAGLAHAYSGTCALDIDAFQAAHEWLERNGVDLFALVAAEGAVQVRSGVANRAKLLYRLPRALRSTKVTAGARTLFELRCATADGLTVQDVVYGLHPEGRPYELLGDPEDIPPLPPTLAALWQRLLAEEQTLPATPAAAVLVPAQVAELRQALTYLDADDRDTWVRVGAALHPHGEQGYGLWAEWSQQSEKYDPKDQRRVWKSFRDAQPNNATFRSLFAMAQARGWVNPLSREAAPATKPAASPRGSLLERTRAHLTPGEVPPREWVLKDWLPARASTVFHADGGTGKTRILVQLAMSVALGRPLLGLDVALPGKVLLVSAEEDEESIGRVIYEVAAGLQLTDEERAHFAAQIVVIDLTREPSQILYGATGHGTFGLTPLGQEVYAYALELKPRLLGIDNNTFCYAGPPTEAPHIAAYLNTWRNAVRDSGGAALTLMHEAKASLRGERDGHAYGGHTAWNNSARQRLEMYRPHDDPGVRIIRRAKSNYGPTDGKDEGLRVVWQNGAFLPEVSGGLVERLRAQNDVRAVVDIVRRLIQSHQVVSPSPKAHTNPTALAKTFGIKLPMPTQRFWPALSVAIEQRLLVVEAYRDVHRKDRERLVLGPEIETEE